MFSKKIFLILTAAVLMIVGFLLIIGLSTKTAEEYNQEGKKYLLNQDWLKAKENYEKAVGLSPDNPANYYQLGNIFANLGDYESAKWHFNKALDLNPSSLIKNASYLGLGGTYFFAGDYDSAITYIQKSLSGEMVCSEEIECPARKEIIEAAAYPLLGNIYFFLGDLPLSEEYFQKALALLIDDLNTAASVKESAYNGLGFLYSMQGENEKAIEYFNKNIEIQTTSPLKYLPYFGLGQAYLFLNEYDKAVESLLTSLELIEKTLTVPDYVFNKSQIYNTLGKCYLELADFDQAKNFFEKNTNLTENDQFNSDYQRVSALSSAYSGLGEISFNYNDYEAALAHFNSGLQEIAKITPEYFSEKTTLAFSEILLRYQSALAYKKSENILGAKNEIKNIEKIVNSASPEIYAVIENLHWFKDGESIFQKVNSLKNDLAK